MFYVNTISFYHIQNRVILIWFFLIRNCRSFIWFTHYCN